MKSKLLKTHPLLLMICLFYSLVPAASLPTLAVLSLKPSNVQLLDATMMTNLIRSSIVNTGLYTVLDRENTDKILHEQSLPGAGITADIDAARVGRLLNVQKIIVGSLTWFNNSYYLEASIIDVQTSTIERSRTERCSTIDDFERVASHFVSLMTGTGTLVNSPRTAPYDRLVDSVHDTGSTDMAFYQIQKASNDSGSLSPVQKTALRFRTAGFTSDDFQRFTHSGLSESEWSAAERKSVPVAGLIGLSPIGSGFFYMHDIGLALFISLAKVGAIIGMIPFNGKGGEDKNMRWIYPVVYGGATLFDITGSITASHTYNLRLAALKSSCGNAQAGFGLNSLSALATIQF